MEKFVKMRYLSRSIFCISQALSTTPTGTSTTINHHLNHGNRCLSTVTNRCLAADSRSPLLKTVSIGSTRFFSDDIARMPNLNDAEIKTAIKELLAADWSEIPSGVIYDAKNALTKSTEDKAGQEILKNVLHAAEAVEEFTGKLVSLRMEIDDTVGISGENVKPLPDIFAKALLTAFQRYNAYLEAFGPDENFLRKKVENELGTRMIHLKMRCGGLSSEWGKITVLGTSGLSGSYVEQRA